MRDPEFGPVRARAFGTYAFRVSNPGTFIKEIVGTDGHFTTPEITDQIRNILVAPLLRRDGRVGDPRPRHGCEL